MKHLERLKKMVNLSIKLEWIIKNPFQKFQLKFDKYDRQYLTERELSLIENTYFKQERLEKVKDCFLFSCYTGLSYIDVKELTNNQIAKGIDNNYWIFTKREKTNEKVKVPILPQAMDIIRKYQGISENSKAKPILPLSSNQKTNSYLKEIATATGIHKNITFHVAQIYARVLDTKISEDINTLLERFERKKRNQINQSNVFKAVDSEAG